MKRLTLPSCPGRFKTNTINNCLSPVWDYMCQVPVSSLASVSDLTVRLYDKDKFTADDPLGDCVIPVSVVRRAQHSQTDQGRVSLYWTSLTSF